MSIAPGSTLGPYTITAELGRGGMGVVYAAQDSRLKRRVAIKLLPPDLTRDETAKQRFLQEAQAASALDHPNICTIHEINETPEGQLYLVMAHYEGETLKERIEQRPLALEEAVDIATQVGAGLEDAHGAGIVHRDIKPANLLVTTSGMVKILDFGLAKLAGTEDVTQTGTALGTVAYMSPEQAQGQEVDHRTDIWSLGVVLYEMLAGQQPFQGENLLAVADAIRSRVPSPLRGKAVIMHGALTRALSKDATTRYQAVSELLADLERAKAGATPPASPADMPSIAVLPFANMSSDPEQEYFCDGMSEELINALTKVSGLRVIARTSAFSFKGSNADITTIGEKLKVAAVLEGSVRKAGHRLRITAQLVDVTGGHHLWSEVYDRSLEDVFEIQNEIARTIVLTVAPKLFDGSRTPLVVRPTESNEAYELYLRAGERISGIDRWDTRAAISLLEDATAIDPGFAGAWARLAFGCCQMGFQFEDSLAWHEQAQEAVRRAFEIDPKNAEAKLAHARILWSPRGGFENRPALRALREAVELQPGSHEALKWQYLVFLHVGLTDEAREGLADLLRSQPNDPSTLNFLCHTAFADGCYEEASEYRERAAAVDPRQFLTQVFQPTMQMYVGNLEAAEQGLAEARQLHGDIPLLDASEALLWARRGETSKAEGALARAQMDKPSLGHEHHTWHFEAATYATLGKYPEAIAKIRRAAGAGLPNYPMFRNDPHFALLREEPDMKRLLAELEDEHREFRREFGRQGA